MRSTLRSFVFVVVGTLLITAHPQAARAAAPSPAYKPPGGSVPACASPPARHVSFGSGEKLDFDIDALGAVIARFSLSAKTAPGGWSIRSTEKTGSLAGNFHAVEGTTLSVLGRGLESKRYEEDNTENGIHRTVDVRFPPSSDGLLDVRASRDGLPETFAVQVADTTRDMVGALYAVRGFDLTPGTRFCVPVFGARRGWNLSVEVAGREKLRVPAGSFETVHLAGTAVRVDKPEQRREIHLWLTDDATHLPVAAFGEIQSRPVRAQLVSYEAGKSRIRADKKQ